MMAFTLKVIISNDINNSSTIKKIKPIKRINISLLIKL